MENLRIVYLGTPDFAVEPLRRLVEKQKECESGDCFHCFCPLLGID